MAEIRRPPARRAFCVAVGSDERERRPVAGLVVCTWFGVHKNGEGTWTLTHLPTGGAIGAAHVTRGSAIRLARKLARLGGWDFWTEASMPKRLKEAVPCVQGFIAGEAPRP